MQSQSGGADMANPDVSLVIPVYNEERRIGASIKAIHEYFCSQEYSSEIIVVDDGSVDATLSLVTEAKDWVSNLRIFANQHRGKAVAVRTGVFAAAGSYIAFTDADLSTPLTELPRLLQALDQGAQVAIGSREGAGALRIGEPAHRHLMGRGFNHLVGLLLQQPFRDTQFSTTE
jgi:dolichyl-phosphate beta-glucosyltransferase